MTTARRLSIELAGVIDILDEDRIQISDKARNRLCEARDTLGWLDHQADWRAAAPEPPTPEPTGAEADYRERVALVEQHLEDARKEHWPPTARAEALRQAQVHATLAQAAATLMAAEPRVEYAERPPSFEIRGGGGRTIAHVPASPWPFENAACYACGIEDVSVATRQGLFCDLDCACAAATAKAAE